MRTTTTPRGATLIETMVAMAVLLIGSTGLVGLHRAGLKVENDSRRITRATAIAQDLVSQMEQWRYDDARLANASTTNDATLGDPGAAFETVDDPVAGRQADHAEGDLTASGAVWLGLPSSQIGDYQRFWNVAYPDDTNANAVPDSVRIAVIVRWPSMGAYRRVVLLATKPNPAEAK
jgi:Tfp pilus assembly protein PilV